VTYVGQEIAIERLNNLPTVQNSRGSNKSRNHSTGYDTQQANQNKTAWLIYLPNKLKNFIIKWRSLFQKMKLRKLE
jgi:hypothetical protein